MIARRALELLTESDDPQQEMRWAERRLWEAGLLNFDPPSLPARWTEQVIAENLDVLDQSVPWLRERGSEPQNAETFEQLILTLIPSDGGL